jgi:hypothetical protein
VFNAAIILTRCKLSLKRLIPALKENTRIWRELISLSEILDAHFETAFVSQAQLPKRMASHFFQKL